jgi:hypothetical protein
MKDSCEKNNMITRSISCSPKMSDRKDYETEGQIQNKRISGTWVNKMKMDLPRGAQGL